MWCVQYEEPQSSICQLVSAHINLYITLKWHGSLSAKDKKAAILGYSHDPTRHKLASTSRHYTQLTATWHDSTLLNSSTFFSSQSKLIFKVPTTTWGAPPSHILTNLNYKLIIGCQCQQEMGKISNFTDSEQLKTPKTDCVLKVYKDKEFYQLGLQICWPWKYRGACHLNLVNARNSISGI